MNHEQKERLNMENNPIYEPDYVPSGESKYGQLNWQGKIGLLIENGVAVNRVELLPDGVRVAVVDLPADYAEAWERVKEIRGGLIIDGDEYGFSGWNSDTFIAYFRTDKVTARVKS